MNELIAELFEEHVNDKWEILFTDFALAIETACKAQRNACVREFRRYSKANEYEISENWARAISKSKIKRQDYE